MVIVKQLRCENRAKELLESFEMSFGHPVAGSALARRMQSAFVMGISIARDVFVQRQGVCRDFAYLAIVLCRGLGIPARYVCGYAAELHPPDFHGFFEAYLGERWYLLDPTRLAPVSGFVRIAAGQEAADVPFATFIGAAQLKSKIVWTNRPTNSITPPQFSDQMAVSTA